MKFILILLIIIFFYIYNSNYEYFDSSNDNIIFLSASETNNTLMNTFDNHFSRFNKYDLISRKVNSVDEYLNKISQVGVNLKYNKKDIIIKCIEIINNELIDQINENWIDNNKLKQITWKIGVIDGKVYEAGLPHTRNDTIIIPYKQIKFTSNFINTLLHEKLHVYQKIYPEDFKIYLEENNYTKYIKYINSNINYRSNPDTDDWIYKQNNQLYMSKYNTLYPDTILDVKYYPKNSSKYEHPTEKSVYNLLEKIKIKNT